MVNDAVRRSALNTNPKSELLNEADARPTTRYTYGETSYHRASMLIAALPPDQPLLFQTRRNRLGEVGDLKVENFIDVGEVHGCG